MKTAFLYNTNLESLSQRLRREGHEIYTAKGYDVWKSEILNSESVFAKGSFDACFILLHGETLAQDTAALGEAAAIIQKALSLKPRCKFYISDLDYPASPVLGLKSPEPAYILEQAWRTHLDSLVQNNQNAYYFHLKALVSYYGQSAVYSPKIWYLSACPFSLSGEKILAEKISRIINISLNPRKKCLVLDLDNTLWGGVIGEDGLDGIELDGFKEGARYKNFQQALRAIKDTGIILAIASKNNPEDVALAFTHPHMVLKPADFAVQKTGWEAKSESLREIAAELNFGLDALVFIDDNPVEREMVRQVLPEVAVPDFPSDTTRLALFAHEIYETYFFLDQLSTEDIEKNAMYLANLSRAHFEKQFDSLEDFLREMDMSIYIGHNDKALANRIHQMLLKTNQFNLTGEKYSLDQIYQMIEQRETDVFTGHVKDKFGDNGVSILAIIEKEKDNAKIISMLMSCRIMSRHIEHAFLGFIEDIMQNQGIRRMFAKYVPTEKNLPARYFFEDRHYQLDKEDPSGVKYYRLDLAEKDKEAESCPVTIHYPSTI